MMENFEKQPISPHFFSMARFFVFQFTCLETHFKCSGNGTRQAFCIPNDLKCNGRVNCPNGEDERNCAINCKNDQVEYLILQNLSLEHFQDADFWFWFAV